MTSQQERLDSVFKGSLGRFWLGIDNKLPNDNALTGYVRRTDSNLIEMEVLVEVDIDHLEDLTEYLTPKATSAFGLVRPTVIALFDPAPHTASLKIGGGASVEIYRFRAISTNVEIDELQSTNIFEISGQFRDLLGWAGLSPFKRTFHTDGSKLRQVEYVLQAKSEVLETRLTPTINVRIEANWRTDENRESAYLYTYLQVTVSSTAPQPVAKMANLLLDVRKLLCTVHQRDIWAERCVARLDFAEDHGAVDFWHSRVNTEATRPGSFNQNDPRSFVDLATIGGIDTVARWIRYTQKYPRLVSPITNYWSLGSKTPAAELTELAMSMEYAVAVAKKTRKRPIWTQKKSAAAAIVDRVGRPFADWCQDPNEWAALFWDLYNHLKHNHLDRDPREIAIMALSARILLTAYILDRVSDNRRAATKFLDDYRWEGIRERVRVLLSESNLTTMSRRQRRRKKKGV